MSAVRDEVDELKEKIKDLNKKIDNLDDENSRLKAENEELRSKLPPDVVAQVQAKIAHSPPKVCFSNIVIHSQYDYCRAYPSQVHASQKLRFIRNQYYDRKVAIVKGWFRRGMKIHNHCAHRICQMGTPRRDCAHSENVCESSRHFFVVRCPCRLCYVIYLWLYSAVMCNIVLISSYSYLH